MSKIHKNLLLLIIIFMSNNSSIANDRISNLITPVSYFTDHIKQLQSIQNNLDKYKTTSLVGSSGMGKTQIARMYAYENRDNYNLIWFFDCNLDLSLEFLKLAKIINNTFKANISESPVLAKKEVMDYLASMDKWVLIFDNLKIGDNDKVKDLVHWEHNGDVIFCSQDSEILPYTIKITPFNKEDTVTLAKNLLNTKNQKDIEFLATEFMGYPVIIVQGAQLLNQVQGLDREYYKTKIQQSADKIKLNVILAIQELTPTAANLLNKISLINNQSFSKQLLNVITDDPATLSDDVYQLSKLMLISNTTPGEENSIFEMHDVIAQKVSEINGDINNKKYLERIIAKLVQAIPLSIHKSHIFRNKRTIPENLEIIAENAQKYKVSTQTLLTLNLHLMSQYIQSLNYYNNAAKIVDWFNENESNGNLNSLSMNATEKNDYASFLSIMGWYNRTRCADWNKAIEYLTKAKEVISDVHGYEASKFNIIYQLSVANVALGKKNAAESNISDMEKMEAENLVDIGDIGFLYYAKARVFVIQGNYHEALKWTDKAIEAFINSGVKSNDLAFTNPYLRKAEILNALGRYQEAKVQMEQLYNMHKVSKKEDHEIFGRIFTQIARSELGQGQLTDATYNIQKSIGIFINDKKRNPENGISEDVDLAYAYVTQGDIFFAQDKPREAIDSYRDAQKIYFYLYKDNRKNVAHVSYLYTQGAKAACRAKDLYHYRCFGRSQIRDFGLEHQNTITITEYCKNYNIGTTELWQED